LPEADKYDKDMIGAVLREIGPPALQVKHAAEAALSDLLPELSHNL